MDSPQTLAEWWDYVKTDDPILKSKYLLRNYSGIGYSVKQLLDFLATKTNFTCHRLYCPARCDVSGCYSIQGEKENIIFRVDPTTPTINGSRPFPSILVCW